MLARPRGGAVGFALRVAAAFAGRGLSPLLRTLAFAFPRPVLPPRLLRHSATHKNWVRLPVAQKGEGKTLPKSAVQVSRILSDGVASSLKIVETIGSNGGTSVERNAVVLAVNDGVGQLAFAKAIEILLACDVGVDFGIA